MNISNDDRKAIGLILLYTSLVFSLVGTAARLKSDFHSRGLISKAGWCAGAILATLGVVTLVLAWLKKQR
jgi:hypothetical protein